MNNILSLDKASLNPINNIRLSVVPPLPWRRRRRREVLIKGLKRHTRLAATWDRHGPPVPRWTLTRYGLDKTPKRRINTKSKYQT